MEGLSLEVRLKIIGAAAQTLRGLCDAADADRWLDPKTVDAISQSLLLMRSVRTAVERGFEANYTGEEVACICSYWGIDEAIESFFHAEQVAKTDHEYGATNFGHSNYLRHCADASFWVGRLIEEIVATYHPKVPE